jgi:Ca-activated chloride channel family protein
MRGRIAALALAALVAGCNAPPPAEPRSEAPPAGAPFIIVSGSENRPLEPLVMRFCAERRVPCEMRYRGSLEIGLMLRPGTSPEIDAVWPASSIWVELNDTSRRIRHLASIYQTPVVLGVRASRLRELGWAPGQAVGYADIQAAVESGRLRYVMTSATQSNSGAMFYLAMLAAAAGEPDEIEPGSLGDERARGQVQAILRGIERSSESSGWLKDLFLDADRRGEPFAAMVNYEAVLWETNAELRARGHELLVAVYPREGVGVADSPLGFLDRGQGREAFFLDLQRHLLAQPAQAEIARQGRRVSLGRAAPAPAEPEWNFDPSRPLAAVARMPDADTLRAALVAYQEALRKPSLTVFCLDYSGSMRGRGYAQLSAAMTELLTPARAAESLIQWSPEDRTFLIPFSSAPWAVTEGTGAPAAQAELLQRVLSERPDGGTDIYACVRDGAPPARAGPARRARALPARGGADDRWPLGRRERHRAQGLRRGAALDRHRGAGVLDHLRRRRSAPARGSRDPHPCPRVRRHT